MSSNGWKATLLTLFVSAFVSACGFYVQWESNNKQLAQVQTQWKVERLKMVAEKAKLEAELNDLQDHQLLVDNQRQELVSGLKEINQNIAAWDNFIAKRQNTRELKIDIYTKRGSRKLTQDNEKEISEIDAALSNAWQNKKTLIARRRELELDLLELIK